MNCFSVSSAVNRYDVKEDRNSGIPPRNVEEHQHDYRSDHIEKCMRQRRLLSNPIGRICRKLYGDGCADIRTEHKRQCGVKINETACAKYNHDTGGSRAQLDDHRHHQPDQQRPP